MLPPDDQAASSLRSGTAGGALIRSATRCGVLRFTQRRAVAKDTKIALTQQILDVTEALGEPNI